MAVDVDINLNLEGTERSESLLKRMTDTIQAQRKELETLNRVGQLEGLKQGEREVNALTGRLAAMAKEMQRGSNESDELVKNLRDVANAAGLVEDKAERAGRAVRSIPSGGNQRSVFGGGSGGVGDVAGDVGSVFSSLGSTSKLGVLSDAGDFGDLIEGIFRLRGSAQELAGAANAAAVGSNAAAGGLTAVALAAAPFVAVIAAIGATVAVAKIQASEQQEELRKLVTAEDERIESYKRQQQFLKDLTLAENQARLDANQALIDQITASRDELVAAYGEAFTDSNAYTSLNQIAKSQGGAFKVLDLVLNDSLDNVEETRVKIEAYNKQLDELFAENADLAAVTPERKDLEAAQGFIQFLDNYATEQERLNDLIENGSNAVREEIRSLEEQKQARQNNIRDALEARKAFEEDSEAYNALTTYIEENQAAVGVLSDNLGVLRDTALPAAQAVDEQARASERAKKAIEDAAKAFDEAVAVFEKADSELKDSVQSRIKAQADVVKAENAIADVQAKRATDDARNAERAAAEQNILDQIENAKRVSAAAKVADNIGRIRDEGYAKEQDIATKFLNDSAKALTDYNAQVADLNRDFARDDLRAHEDYNIARYRLARDLELSLFEAARNNDVSAFITARSRGANQLDDQAVDFAVDRRRAGEDQSSNLQDLRESFEAERAERQAAAQQSIAQTRAEVQERIATEQAGAVQRITQEQVLQQQLADLRAMYAQEDFLARRTEEDARMREQVANAQIRFGLAQQTERLLADQAAIAGRNVGIMLINGFVNGVNQYQNAVAAAGFGAAGSIFQNFNFGNIQVGAGVTPGQVKDEVRAGVQAGIDQMGRQNRAVFRRIEA